MGFCLLSLSDSAKERPKSAGNEFKTSNPGVLASFDLKQEILYPPKRDKVCLPKLRDSRCICCIQQHRCDPFT